MTANELAGLLAKYVERRFEDSSRTAKALGEGSANHGRYFGRAEAYQKLLILLRRSDLLRVLLVEIGSDAEIADASSSPTETPAMEPTATQVAAAIVLLRRLNGLDRYEACRRIDPALPLPPTDKGPSECPRCRRSFASYPEYIHHLYATGCPEGSPHPNHQIIPLGPGAK